MIFILRTPGYQVDPMSYLFGDILMVTRGNLWLLAGLDLLVVGVGMLYYHQLQAVCFDEEFARLRGIPVAFFCGVFARLLRNRRRRVHGRGG
jgi:zinc transport system permease protein